MLNRNKNNLKREKWSFESKKGFTLLELMIAMAVSLTVILIVYSTLHSSTQVVNKYTGKAFGRNDARIALTQISKDIEQSVDVINLPAASGGYGFKQSNGKIISYYYDISQKAVMKKVGTTVTRFLDSSTSSLVIIPKTGDTSGRSFQIKMETINPSAIQGKTETEQYAMDATRRIRRAVSIPLLPAITKVTLANGSAVLSFSSNVSGLSLTDFNITATVNGQPYLGGGFLYNDATKTISFTPITQGINDQVLNFTVQPSETTAKIGGGPVTASITIFALPVSIVKLDLSNGKGIITLSNNNCTSTTLQDFIITAKLNGIAKTLNITSYDGATRTFNFTPIPQAASNQVLAVTVQRASNSMRISSGSATAQITIYSTANTSGDIYMDYSKNWYTDGEDWNVDLDSGYYWYDGTGYLVIPVDHTIGTSQDTFIHVKEGIVITPNSGLRIANNGHDISMETDGIINFEGGILDAKSIYLTAGGDINIKSTTFIGDNGNAIIFIASRSGTIYYNERTKVQFGNSVYTLDQAISNGSVILRGTVKKQ